MEIEYLQTDDDEPRSMRKEPPVVLLGWIRQRTADLGLELETVSVALAGKVKGQIFHKYLVVQRGQPGEVAKLLALFPDDTKVTAH